MEADETTEFAGTRSVVTGAVAMTYRTPAPPGSDYDATYYFCCQTCGHCSRRSVGSQPIIEAMVEHVATHPIEGREVLHVRNEAE